MSTGGKELRKNENENGEIWIDFNLSDNFGVFFV